MSENNTTYYLGLTMAGAVSAGAYTGGVMDYIFELLDKWEKAKKGELQGVSKTLVPTHNVVISAMGGTSAGGMTTVMSALNGIVNDIQPITDEHVDTVGGTRNNIFYDSWVNLADEPDLKTLVKALQTNDLEDEIIRSLLNSDFIDEIAASAFAVDGAEGTDPSGKLPSYICPNLEMIISHTMVRGIPLRVVFPNSTAPRDASPSHVSYEHFLFSHFKLNGSEPINPDEYMWLNPYDPKSKDQLRNAAISTGAFPVGLNFRTFDHNQFSEDYLRTILSRLVTGNIGEARPAVRDKVNWDNPYLKQILQNYHSNTVDGGAINNEPYGEVLSILRHKHETQHDSPTAQQSKFGNYGIVMIDPFPDNPEENDAYTAPSNLVGMIAPIIGSLWDQSKVKRKDFADQFENTGIFHGVIYPSKRNKNGEKLKYPIASAALEAFGGFIDIRFRHHDFYLGRNNARNFLRAFFSLPYDTENPANNHPIHQGWTQAMIDRFIVTIDGKNYLPIIPDMNLLLEDKKPTREEAKKYSLPNLPKIEEEVVYELEKYLKKRIRKVTRILIENVLKRKSDLAWWQVLKRAKRSVRDTILFGGNRLVASKVNDLIIRTILKDLEERGLLVGTHSPLLHQKTPVNNDTTSNE